MTMQSWIRLQNTTQKVFRSPPSIPGMEMQVITLANTTSSRTDVNFADATYFVPGRMLQPVSRYTYYLMPFGICWMYVATEILMLVTYGIASCRAKEYYHAHR